MSIYDELINANLPVISATENGNISMGPMTDEEQELFQDILTAYFQPDIWADVQQHRSNVAAYKDEYSNALTTLTSIRDAKALTQTEAIQAIQYMAKINIFIVRLLIKMIG